MDQDAKGFPLAKYDQVWPGQWRDGYILLLLVLIALGIRGCVVWQTEVPARDSIGFIRYALQFENLPWKTVICQQHQHPGYPLTVLAVSWPVRWLAGETDCYSMQLSAQLASSAAGVLLVLPMFYLGKFMFGRSVGFWAAVLFQCLPGSGHVLSDAISDPLFLCLSTTALLFAVRAVAGNELRLFALCGLFCGLTYLVRPEGVLVVVATGLVLAGMQLMPQRRRPWRTSFACAGALIGAALVAGSPYYLTTLTFTNKPSAELVTGKMQAAAEERLDPESCASPLLAVHIGTEGSTTTRRLLGVKGILAELAHAYQYVGWIPALLAVWWCWDRFRSWPGGWVMLLLFVLHFALVWRLAVKAGYVSDRHILLLVVCSIFQAVAGTMQIPHRLTAWWRGRGYRFALATSGWALALLLMMVGTGLSRTLHPLHGNRAGHHEAGKWLAAHSDPVDVIEDDHCWAHYYANRVFLETSAPRAVQGHPATTFVVFGRANERSAPTTPRKFAEAELVQRGGRIVFHWPEHTSADRAKVVIYQMPRP